MVISSHMEGGANVICEAVAVGTPVIASRIAGNIGMLGVDYAGYYTVSDTAALAALMQRVTTDAAWLAQLTAQCAARRALFLPAAEATALAAVIEETQHLTEEKYHEKMAVDLRTQSAGA